MVLLNSLQGNSSEGGSHDEEPLSLYVLLLLDTEIKTWLSLAFAGTSRKTPGESGIPLPRCALPHPADYGSASVRSQTEVDYLRRRLDFRFEVLGLGRQFELKVNSDLNV